MSKSEKARTASSEFLKWVEELVDYCYDREAEDFKTFVEEGGDPKRHVFTTISAIKGYLTRDPKPPTSTLKPRKVYDQFGRRVLATTVTEDGHVTLYDKKDGNIYYDGPVGMVDDFIDKQIEKEGWTAR